MRASLRRPGVVTLLAISTVGPLIMTAVVVHAISLLRSVGAPTANGSLWAHGYGIESLGGLQGLASSAQIAGAAIGPLPLAISLDATGSDVPGLIALVAGARWSPPSLTSLSPHHPQEVA